MFPNSGFAFDKKNLAVTSDPTTFYNEITHSFSLLATKTANSIKSMIENGVFFSVPPWKCRYVLPFGTDKCIYDITSSLFYYTFAPESGKNEKTYNVHWMIKAHVSLPWWSNRYSITHFILAPISRHSTMRCVSKTDKSSFVHILAEKNETMQKRQWKRNYRAPHREFTHMCEISRREENERTQNIGSKNGYIGFVHINRVRSTDRIDNDLIRQCGRILPLGPYVKHFHFVQFQIEIKVKKTKKLMESNLQFSSEWMQLRSHSLHCTYLFRSVSRLIARSQICLCLAIFR